MKLKTQLPDLAASFARLKTMIELEKVVNDNTVLGFCIKLAFINKRPTPEIIRTIKDAIHDNRRTVENCIPDYIIRSIEKYWPEIKPETDDLKHINI